jgi:hypothetical protein
MGVVWGTQKHQKKITETKPSDMDSGVSSATGKRYRHFGVLPLPK